MNVYTFEINPIAKPRMTQRDKWKERPVVMKYVAYKDLLRLMANKYGLRELPNEIWRLYFFIPMPKTWSQKTKEIMDKQLHMQTPDLDNLLKGFFDAINTEDKQIAHITNGLGKFWAYEGLITLVIDG